MAGASLPLTRMVHQMIDIGPAPRFADTKLLIEYPIVRDMDTNMYERQEGTGLEIGSYAHRPITLESDEIPSIEEAALSPTELPFTQDDFDPQMETALELIPEIVGDETVGVKYAINGVLSVTHDGMPLLGETAEVPGLWSAAAIWIKEGPGAGKTIAELMVHGESEIDAYESNIARAYPCQRTKAHIRARASEGFNKMYGIVHPSEQWESDRRVRLSPFYEREKALGAVFFETAGWERPHWYESNKKLLADYGDRVMPRRYEWDSRWWSPIINAEHLAMRDRVAMVDLSAFAVFDITGTCALDTMQNLCVVQMNVPVGRVIYTSLLNSAAGIKADLTVMRLGPNHFRVVTGGADGPRDKKWFLDHLPEDGAVQLTDLTSSWATIGVWGPRARDLVTSITDADVSNEGFPFGTCRFIDIGPVRALASRISYVGELGWEIYVPFEQGVRLWDAIWQAGQPHGIVPAGIGVYGTTGRIEKCYRAYGMELEQEFNLVETGLARPQVKPQDFIGKEAYLKQRAEPPAITLCTLTIDDNTSRSGFKRYMQGREPVLARDGKRLVDRHGRGSYVTSAGSGPSVGKTILMSFLPPEQARVGNKLCVEYFGEQYPATVAVAGPTPVFDPQNTRVKS